MPFRIIDLSVPIKNNALEPFPQQISYLNHVDSARVRLKRMGLTPQDLPDPGSYMAFEKVIASTHAGTHVDAPYHFGPEVSGERARTIDELPLEWFFGNGVRLDFRWKEPGELITREEVQEALRLINYKINKGDIVLLWTGTTDRFLNDPDFAVKHPGISREALLWIIAQGVRVIGIDAWSLDRPVPLMVEDLIKGDKERFFPAHFTGREKHYTHAEKLTNLGAIPRPTGFKVALFPVKIEGASGGWTRAVAIVEE